MLTWLQKAIQHRSGQPAAAGYHSRALHPFKQGEGRVPGPRRPRAPLPAVSVSEAIPCLLPKLGQGDRL